MGYHDPGYNTYFDIFMVEGACNEIILFSNVTLLDCESFAQGIVNQSFALAMARHFENLRYVITLYDSINDDPGIEFPGHVTEFTSDMQRNKILSILNLNVSTEISLIIYI
jgi:hypothetical protein